MRIDTGSVPALNPCRLCPRLCGADRSASFAAKNAKPGYCGADRRLRAAKAMIHEGEEPCLLGEVSGGKDSKDNNATTSGRLYGAGAVFFSGCNLRCVFCQNYEITHENKGWEISVERLSEIFLELQGKGAACLDLVSPTPYVPHIREALSAVKDRLCIPVVFNCGGYESVESLGLMEGLVDIYLPDLKYFDRRIAARYSGAPDYFECASAALDEMYRQTGDVVLDSGQMRRGLLVRHMVLPGCWNDSLKLMDYLGTHFPKGSIAVSILRQYTPCARSSEFPEINRPLTTHEYEKVVARALVNGISGYRQEKESRGIRFVPDFNGSGL